MHNIQIEKGKEKFKIIQYAYLKTNHSQKCTYNMENNVDHIFRIYFHYSISW
jgi:hypothetical protein